MSSHKIAIVGGGLAGLYAAYRLQRLGIDWELFEARPRLGGRILSTPAGGLDLGPTWFWPDCQPRLQALASELGLETFAQYEDGDALIERWGTQVQRRPGYTSGNLSLRIEGGSGRMVQALAERLPAQRVFLQSELQRIALENDGACLSLAGSGPMRIGFRAVWLAIPPRLAARLRFTPALPTDVVEKLVEVPTWMASHAKYVARYARPFWRESGLSGDAFSGIGPLAEVHDAGHAGGAALFGFLGLSAAQRRAMDAPALMAACRAQLVRLFGEAAAHPIDESLQDWAQEPLTATEDDQIPPRWHGLQDLTGLLDGHAQQRLRLIGSEAGGEQAGYMEGALLAVERAVQALPSD
ncbi:FAD-dependent oxidoreductase [Pseudomonas sp. LABIM340]|uniref:flavin monoamine oxidase family protein n=1 Tax=Pseudomonas sp. LABIM340 TaxID=3156585 RepID=UPI0032AF9E05